MVSFRSTPRKVIFSEHIQRRLSLNAWFHALHARRIPKHLAASHKQCHCVIQDGSKGVGTVASFKAGMRDKPDLLDKLRSAGLLSSGCKCFF